MKRHFEKLKKFKNYNEKGEKAKDVEFSEMIIHLSDLSGPAKTWNISKIWSKRCNREF